MPSPGPLSPPGILIDEELSPVYNSKYFYPAKPGEVLANRYQTMVKVGWGVSSTVWLARDLQRHIEEPENVVALKITNNNSSSTGHERKVAEHISTADPSHPGHSLIRTLLDSFEVEGPEDLKLENIMVSFEDQTVLADFMNYHLENPMAFKVDLTGRPVYQSVNDFGPLRSLRSIPQLVDFGLATRLEEDDDWGVWPIQPVHYQAPEVILGNGWQMPADIWNVGVLLWDIIEGRELFQHIHDHAGHYNAKLHIAEMIALLGSPPPEVIQRYQYMREYLWPEPVRREDGRLCETAEEYFCGPFFDEKGITGFLISNESFSDLQNILGCFLYEDLIPDRKITGSLNNGLSALIIVFLIASAATLEPFRFPIASGRLLTRRSGAAGALQFVGAGKLKGRHQSVILSHQDMPIASDTMRMGFTVPISFLSFGR
ncbi:hypothetical protein FQN53_000115 [Emmonsiellopsis sp. PD_33]|nr:hypothetical protein FQN53_000115 [Emmonsiellopsis sp. PD_33]